MTPLVKLHTKDRNVVYIENTLVKKVPGFKSVLGTIETFDEFVDIILADYTSISVNHILNIIKHGSTAVFKDDMKDVVEAGKLFLNVDLGSGIIRKSGEGFEFEIEQRFTCQKYVSSTSKDKEIVSICLKTFDRETDIIVKEEVKEKQIDPAIEIFQSGVVKEAKRMNEIKVDHKQTNENEIDKSLFDSNESAEIFLKTVGENKVYSDLGEEIGFEDYQINKKDINPDYMKMKETIKKKKELKEIIIHNNSRIRLFNHYKKLKDKNVEKEKRGFQV